MGNTHEDDEIDLKELFFALKKRIWLLLAAGLLAGCLAAGYTKFLVTPIYSSTSSLLVLSKETTLTSLADLQLGSQLANDYSLLIKSRPVLEEVIGNLNLDMDYKTLRDNISIENPADTRMLYLTVNNPDPIVAQELVDELSEVSSRYIGDKMEVTPPKIIETGEVALYPDSPNVKKTALLGVLAGLIVSAGIVIVLNLMNDTVKTEEDIAKYLELATFAVVPDKNSVRRNKSKEKKNQKGR